MLSGIITALGLLPEIISLIKQLVAFVQDEETRLDQKAKAKALAAAINTAQTTKDTSHLENLFNPPATAS